MTYVPTNGADVSLEPGHFGPPTFPAPGWVCQPLSQPEEGGRVKFIIDGETEREFFVPAGAGPTYISAEMVCLPDGSAEV